MQIPEARRSSPVVEPLLLPHACMQEYVTTKTYIECRTPQTARRHSSFVQPSPALADAAEGLRKPGHDADARYFQCADAGPGHTELYRVRKLSEMRRASEADLRFASVSTQPRRRYGSQDADMGLMVDTGLRDSSLLAQHESESWYKALLRCCCNGFFSDRKVLRRSLVRDFVREMRTLSKLRHPNIVTVMGAVLKANRSALNPLLVMELMEVRPLVRWLNACIVYESQALRELMNVGMVLCVRAGGNEAIFNTHTHTHTHTEWIAARRPTQRHDSPGRRFAHAPDKVRDSSPISMFVFACEGKQQDSVWRMSRSIVWCTCTG